jgi:hypothetical protein
MKKAILRSNKLITRNSGSKAYPLNEENMPKGDGSPKSLTDIVNFLDVEHSQRYVQKFVGGKMVATYCNIYAFDYCNLAGGYLPRVWWYPKAVADLQKGLDLEPKYAETVQELNANSLYDWFVEFADDFGWKKETDLQKAQGLANIGQIVIIVAKQKITSRSGHITAIVPEVQEHKSKFVGSVYQPLQSQAGALNKKYLNDNWFTHSRYYGFGIWSFQTK